MSASLVLPGIMHLLRVDEVYDGTGEYRLRVEIDGPRQASAVLTQRDVDALHVFLGHFRSEPQP